MAVKEYFVTRRPLANGLLFTGAGLAMALGPLATIASVDHLGVPRVSVRYVSVCAHFADLLWHDRLLFAYFGLRHYISAQVALGY
jgi:hypothetical protein